MIEKVSSEIVNESGESQSLVYTSPFVWNKNSKDYSFVAIDPDSGNKICDALYIRGLIDSLLKDEGETDIVGCGCSVAGCSGFSSEKFSKTDESVIWEIVQHDNKYRLCFDRSMYEREALAILNNMVTNDVGWNELSVPEYESFEAFKEDVLEVEDALK